ncbi:TonB family protein [Lentibacter algarum]|uniref:TonB family protein n=1 Tax=Lentibacter algarum TaxID=576131 RepID=UPI001C0780F3|nr:TonB family protein [Lentibacter algarum]MBU2980709.1 TonB family protein [Lentibacter algarum]
MTRAGEFAAFFGLAALVHVGLFAQFGQSGAQSQGEAGQASVSLMTSPADMTARVAEWTRPVEAMQDLPEALAPLNAAQTSAQPLAPLPTPPAMKPHQTTPLAAPTEGHVQLDTQSATPTVAALAPDTSKRPKTRPAPAAKPRRSQPASSAPAKQKASGGQTGQNAGNTAVTRSATLSKAKRRNLMAQWGASIRNRIERQKRYPSGTNASGTTVLRIVVSKAGRVVGVSLAKSSGNRKLDQAAIRAVKRARLTAAPKGLSAAQFKFNLPVAFSKK